MENGRWYWVRLKGSQDWFPARYDTTKNCKWTNGDCWFDLHGEVEAWRLIELPAKEEESVRLFEADKQCEYDDCKSTSTRLAYDRITVKTGQYCKSHSKRILMNDIPEYTTTCPNCGCEFGVN